MLILTPFKQMAAFIVETIVFLTNNGKWKGVSRRKKFKNDFFDADDAFNDNFKIGLSYKHRAKT